MDVGGDVADLMVKEGIQLTEASIKLLAAGSKNLTAFLMALARDNKKVKGKTQLGRLLKEGKELKVFRVKECDLKDFTKHSKQYGILYAAVKDKRGGDMIDLITNVDYVSQVNRVMERMGYAAPAREQGDEPPKKADPRARPANSSPERGSGSKPSQTRTATTNDKPSVRGRLDALRTASEGMKGGKAPQRTRSPQQKTR